jgi:cytochrome c biogenesis protein CcmG/thiol:disulfide interchange protein DsbE
MKIRLVILMLFVFFSSPAFAALKTNDPAPAFSLPAVQGGKFTFAPPQKTGTIVSFFASWCIPCRKELPLLNALSDELKSKGISIVLVNVREDTDAIRRLLAELKVDKPMVVSDRDGAVSSKYRVLFFPTTFFVGPDGRVKDIIFGEIRDETQLRKSADSIAAR